MPEREVAVCSADEDQQARNSSPELRIFFLLASHGHVYALAGYGCLRGFIALCQDFELGFGSVLTLTSRSGEGPPRISGHGQNLPAVAKPCGDESQNHKCCAPGSLYKLVMPEREVAVCSAVPKQLSRAPHLFSLGITWYFLHDP